MRLAIVICCLFGLTAAAVADPVDCLPSLDLLQNPLEPVAYSVSGPEKLHFIVNERDQAGCPSLLTQCQRKGYLLPGDTVVATSINGAYACASYASSKAPYSITHGWLPLADLTPVSSPPDWEGDWRSGDEEQIDITSVAGGKLKLSGAASYGMHDPDRVERGAINVGEIHVSVAPTGDSMAFNIGDNETTEPYADEPVDYSCGVRLWQRGPYLIVSDNRLCGGNNVSFNGVYARAR